MKRFEKGLLYLCWIICVPAGQTWAKAPNDACQKQPLLERWLANQLPNWQRLLLPMVGYEPPIGIEICISNTGQPRADYNANRIWLSHLDDQQDHLSLAHEYLHLAFKYSPKAHDEVFIESTARLLVQGGYDAL